MQQRSFAGKLVLLAMLLAALVAGCAAPAAAPAAPAAEAPAAEAPAAETEAAPAEAAPAETEAAAAEGGEAAAPAAGQTTASGFPDKAIQMMAPANPGGGWDTTARLLAQAMQESGVSPVPVEVFNVPGAGGTVGLAQLASQNAGDAYTPMMMGLVMVGAIVTNASPVTLENATPLARLIAEYEIIVVPADSPHQTLQDLVDAFVADPRSVSWGGGSAGGTDHILVGLIAKEAGVDASGINYIAYSGGGEAAASILGGQVTAGVSGVGEFVEFVNSGDMRALAVSSEERLEALPDVPTLREAGVDIALLNWRGLVAPPDISDEERQWWIDALSAVNESEEWQTVLETNGWDNVFLPGDEFTAYLEEQTAEVTTVLQEIGLVQ
jgi:putative tricarboxylic transport membrane protein